MSLGGEASRPRPSPYIIVGDNIDKTVNPRFMTSDHQRQSIHYFHSYGVQDRVKCHDVPDSSPVGSIDQLPPCAFLPDSKDCMQLRKHYAILVSRILVDQSSFFKGFKDCVVRHIPHEHTVTMSQKSNIVSGTYIKYC